MDHHLQPPELLPIAALCVLLSTLAGCTVLNPTHGLEGLMGPFFGSAVSITGNEALIGSEGGAGGNSPGLAYVFEQTSDGWIQRAALSAEGGKPGNEFGSAVAFAERTALVGAWGTNGVAPVSGSAYVFERGPTGWVQAAVLINPDAQERHLLGVSVALDGNTAVVGAPGANRNLGRGPFKTVRAWSGNVYVWSRGETGWQYQAKLTPDSSLLPTDPSSQPHSPARNFGEKVAIHGNILVVTAHQGTVSPGKVYIFRRHNNTWIQEARLEQKQAFFGISIAISNETVAVASQGAIFVYTRINSDWRLQAKVEPHVAGEETGFQYGGSLSIDGNLMVAGALRYKKRKGAAFVFERVETDWKQVAMLTGKDTQSDRLFRGAAGDLFGVSTSIYGETIVIGASFHDSEGPNNGAAYVFMREGSRWVQKAKLTARIPQVNAR